MKRNTIKYSSVTRPGFYGIILRRLDLTGRNITQGLLVANCEDEAPLPPRTQNVCRGNM